MGSDEARATLAAARGMFPGEPAQALRLFERAVALAAGVGDAALEADAELGYGESLYLLDGRERESLPHLRRAAGLAAGTVTAALAWMTSGDALRFLSEVEPALSAYAHAAQAFTDLGDAFGEGCGSSAGTA